MFNKTTKNLITDINDARVKSYQSLRLGTKEEGIYIVEGFHAVRQALASKDEVIQLFLSSDFIRKFPTLNKNELQNLKDDTEILFAEKSLMSKLVGYHLHQGALGKVLIPSSLGSINENSFPVVALDRIEKSENVGAIVRTALVFGFKTILLSKTSCSPYVRRAVRVSMGAVCHCNVIEVDDLLPYITNLKDSFSDINIIALEQTPYSVSYQECCYSNKSLVILGNETVGIQKAILNIADQVVEIPMDRVNISSLNVAVSAGILLAALSK